ncbi:MAG: nucleotidyltransferase family protein [Pseudomonadota bacterium]
MSDLPDVAMILAAGFGTRMGALTEDRPKPLIEAGGKALIDHALDAAAAAGVSRAVVNLHYRGDQIRRHLAGRRRPEIVFSEEPEILETGGGIVRALPLLGPAPFFSLNADAIWTGAAPLPTLAAAWRGGRMDALLHLARREDAVGHAGRGDFFRSDDGGLSRRGEAATAPYVFTGAQIIAPEAFVGAPRGAFSTNVVWDRLIARGRLFGVAHDGSWIDVGSPAGLALAEEALR